MNRAALVTSAIEALELLGTAAMLFGIALSAVMYVSAGRRSGWGPAYRPLRANIGRSILLGLELLVAADLLKTLKVTPQIEDIGVLAGLLAIRTFLSVALGVEINGHWPWQEAQFKQDRGDGQGPCAP